MLQTHLQVQLWSSDKTGAGISVSFYSPWVSGSSSYCIWPKYQTVMDWEKKVHLTRASA